MAKGKAKIAFHVRLTKPNYDWVSEIANNMGISFNRALNEVLEGASKLRFDGEDKHEQPAILRKD
jgi:hypothetical protein